MGMGKCTTWCVNERYGANCRTCGHARSAREETGGSRGRQGLEASVCPGPAGVSWEASGDLTPTATSGRRGGSETRVPESLGVGGMCDTWDRGAMA